MFGKGIATVFGRRRNIRASVAIITRLNRWERADHDTLVRRGKARRLRRVMWRRRDRSIKAKFRLRRTRSGGGLPALACLVVYDCLIEIDRPERSRCADGAGPSGRDTQSGSPITAPEAWGFDNR